MWSDIETKRDYLNYAEVAEVVAEILVDPGMRPVSVGIFGTWGTGKSSLLNLIEAELKQRAGDDTIVIRFDAWLYQGYDDARAALMDVIARSLYEEARDKEGLFGLAKRLLARVNTMRTLGLAVEVLAATHGIPMFGAAAKAVGAIGNFVDGKPGEEDAKAVAEGGKAVAGLVDPEKKKSPPEEIDAFRREFGELLAGLKKTMVVFVDNLDRCLPAQTIHTLEALRLFLFMDQSAFVVAADEDMVRHSVSEHFGGVDVRHVKDYLDKLIQVPVRVPRLGVAEIRAFLFMLFAEAAKVPENDLSALRKRLETNLRSSWKEQPLSIADAVGALGADGKNLAAAFDIADRMAALLAKSTYVEGNPRIVKRLLNVVRLRARIAQRREMPVDEGMVAKFALFERCASPRAVTKLYSLINEAPKGQPPLIVDLEKLLEDQEAFNEASPKEWEDDAPFLWDWFGLKPSLAGQDLRALIYLSRETTALRNESAGLSQAAAQAFERLRKVTTMASPAAKAAIKEIPAAERLGVMRELVELFRPHPDWQTKPEAFTGAALLAEADGQGGAAAGLLANFIRNLPKQPPWLLALVRDKAWFKEEK
jgi:predicted KAP-like P-loop ATPase